MQNNDLISRSALLVVPNVRKVTEYDEAGYSVSYNAVPLDVIENVPTVDAEPVRRGCQYCSGELAEYQHSIHTKVYINTIGKAQALVTECSSCPPYANCSMKDVPARSAFIINFCPNCGRKLNAEVER